MNIFKSLFGGGDDDREGMDDALDANAMKNLNRIRQSQMTRTSKGKNRTGPVPMHDARGGMRRGQRRESAQDRKARKRYFKAEWRKRYDEETLLAQQAVLRTRSKRLAPMRANVRRGLEYKANKLANTGR